MKKVFISSVIRGYEDRRDAAREAVYELQQDGFDVRPVVIEREPQKGKPPRKECLEAARDCDVYILILGNSYGTIVPETGLSLTHEEYRTAVENDRPIFVFRDKMVSDEPDERQREFIREVGDTIHGYRWNEFKSIGDLNLLVYRILGGYCTGVFQRAPKLELFFANRERCITITPRVRPPSHERSVKLPIDSVDQEFVQQLSQYSKTIKQTLARIPGYGQMQALTERLAMKRRQYQEEMARLCKVDLIIVNDGNIPATDIDVWVHIPEGWEARNESQLPRDPSDRLSLSSIATAIHRIEPVIDSGEAKWHINKLKHKLHAELRPIYFSPDEEGIYGLSYTISADELDDLVQGSLHVHVKFGTAPTPA